MLPALVLASWWAQAEPAPAEPIPPQPAAAPAPPPAWLFDNRLAITVGWGHRLGDEGARVGPRDGFAVTAGHEYRFLQLPHKLDLAGGVEFDYDKFATTVTGTVMPSPGQTQTYSGTRTLSYATFAATASLARRQGGVLPFVQLGGGFSIAYFSTPEMALSPGHLTAAQPLLRAAAGLDIALTREIALTARIALTHPFTHPALTTDAGSGAAPASLSFLGDLFDAGAGVALGF